MKIFSIFVSLLFFLIYLYFLDECESLGNKLYPRFREFKAFNYIVWTPLIPSHFFEQNVLCRRICQLLNLFQLSWVPLAVFHPVPRSSTPSVHAYTKFDLRYNMYIIKNPHFNDTYASMLLYSMNLSGSVLV